MPVRGGGGEDGSRGRRRQRWRQQRRGGVATVCRGQLGPGGGGRDGETRRAYVNYYINLRMQVTPHVTVVKSSLCDLFARARAPIHGAPMAKHIICYTYI